MYTLIFNVDPVSKGRPRFTRRGFAYTPNKTRQAERELSILAKQQWKRPALTGAVCVDARFIFPTKNRKLWGKPKITKSDLDNTIKLAFDSLNDVCWHDDAQIVEIHATKEYGERGRIELRIEERA